MPIPPAVIYLRFIPATPTEPANILRRFLMTETARLLGLLGNYTKRHPFQKITIEMT
jgi:hypothetical protein